MTERRFAVTAGLLLAVLPAAAMAEPLPLRLGTYVIRGTGCGDPPFAAIQSYDGIGIAGAHSRACRARLVSRHGNRYVIDDSCIGNGTGPGVRTVTRSAYTILGPAAYRVQSAGSGRALSYDYCAVGSLPASMRSRAVK